MCDVKLVVYLGEGAEEEGKTRWRVHLSLSGKLDTVYILSFKSILFSTFVRGGGAKNLIYTKRFKFHLTGAALLLCS